jgi:pimeloyl-ACP methyl ester carboxylesterase
MNRLLVFPLMIVCIGLWTPVQAGAPAGSAYLDGGSSKVGLILCHGRGKYPTWKVVEPLRRGVYDRLGYHTLSLQMPNEKKKWRLYADDFPKAYETIWQGIRFLREEKGVKTIYLMGHSMGSRMASAFVASNPGASVAGLIVAGCRNSGPRPLDCRQNLRKVRIPVLDIWGGDSWKDNDSALERKGMISDRYRQLKIAGGDHRFKRKQGEFVSAVVDWLTSQRAVAE